MMASFTGHQSWCSVHGMNSREAMNKLADYVKQATGYSLEDSKRMLGGIHLVVFMKDFKVKEISETCGWDEQAGEIRYNTVLDDTHCAIV